MTLQLDGRQRAMLLEMGVRVFWPQPAAGAEAAAVPVPVAIPAPAPAPAPARPAAFEPVAAPAPAPVPAPLAQGALLTSGDPRADWLLLFDPPSQEELRQGQPLVGDAGVLLDNMLRALGLNRRQHACLACVPAAGAAEGPWRAQLEALQPRIVLVLGRSAARLLLQTTEPIGRLRGRAHTWRGLPVVVSYHPTSLLINPADKAKAWADLCLAQSLLRERDT
jgi:DNA polymerase